MAGRFSDLWRSARVFPARVMRASDDACPASPADQARSSHLQRRVRGGFSPPSLTPAGESRPQHRGRINGTRRVRQGTVLRSTQWIARWVNSLAVRRFSFSLMRERYVSTVFGLNFIFAATW